MSSPRPATLFLAALRGLARLAALSPGRPDVYAQPLTSGRFNVLLVRSS